MPLEMWNTLASFGTFLVIAATAVVAIYQLRHIRASNQIAILNELRASQTTPDFVRALHFVYGELTSKMRDPAFRFQLAHRTARTAENNDQISAAELIGDFYENVGVFAKTGLVDPKLLLDVQAVVVLDAWNALSDVTAILRAHYGRALYENFEYLAVLAQDTIAATPDGDYPKNMRRLELPNQWQSADEEYAAALTR